MAQKLDKGACARIQGTRLKQWGVGVGCCILYSDYMGKQLFRPGNETKISKKSKTLKESRKFRLEGI